MTLASCLACGQFVVRVSEKGRLKDGNVGRRSTRELLREARQPSLQTYGGLDLSGVPKTLPLIASEKCSTGYREVKLTRQGRYEARLDSRGKAKTLGAFDTAEEAALIHARATYYLDHEGKPSQDGEKKKKAAALVLHSEETSEAIEASGGDVDGEIKQTNDDFVDDFDDDEDDIVQEIRLMGLLYRIDE